MSRSLQQKGFTLIEMLVIAPIVILAIGAFLTVIISMTGEVLASRGSNAMAYDLQDALNRIEQDVKLSNGFLSEDSFTPATGQGSDNATTKFRNVGESYGPALIISSIATTDNPVNTTTGFVYQKDQPNACGSAAITNNVPEYIDVVYFIKNDSNGVSSLWRRTLLPSDYATGNCATPWQRPSCSPGYSAGFCVTNDVKLAEGVSAGSFTIDYFTSNAATIPDATSSNTAASATDRQTAMRSVTTVNVSIAAAKNIAGRQVERAASLRVTRLETNASSIASIPVQSNMTSAPTNLAATGASASQVNLTWTPPAGTPTSYSVQYSRKSDMSSPTTINNITTPSTTISGLDQATAYFFQVSATNSINTTSYSNFVLGSTTGNHTWSNYTKLTGVGDWNKDGKNDMVGYKSTGDVDLFLGNGETNPTFSGGISLTNIGTVVKDIVGPGTPPTNTAPMLIWTNTNGAAFGLKSDGQYSVTGGTISSAPAGTFTSCAELSAAPLMYTNNTTILLYCRTTVMNLWTLNSSGILASAGSQGSGWNGFTTVFGSGDFNADAKGDIATFDSAGNGTIYIGNGAGWCTCSTASLGSGWTNNRLFGGWDFNGDGKADIMRYAIPTGTLGIYPGNGANYFLTPYNVTIP